MTFADSLASAPRVDRDGYAYIVHPLLDGVPRLDPRLLEHVTDDLCAQPMLQQATLLVAPEAMAIPLATAVSLRTGIPYTIARKRSYGLPGELRVPVATGYSRSILSVCDVRPEDRVVVVDTLVSTGGTLDALLGALRPRCTLVGALVLLDKGRQCAAIAAKHGVPVHPLHTMPASDP